MSLEGAKIAHLQKVQKIRQGFLNYDEEREYIKNNGNYTIFKLPVTQQPITNYSKLSNESSWYTNAENYKRCRQYLEKILKENGRLIDGEEIDNQIYNEAVLLAFQVKLLGQGIPDPKEVKNFLASPKQFVEKKQEEWKGNVQEKNLVNKDSENDEIIDGDDDDDALLLQ